MTYFGFLLRFLGIPLFILAIIAVLDARAGRRLPPSLRTWSPAVVIGAHVIVAVVYTTPWDNYLVATRVWWYDPALVTGIVFGWVPLEEYVFFVLQTIMTGMWLLMLARRMSFDSFRPHGPLRTWSTAVVGVLWVASVVLLFSGWKPGTYLALELSWALIPVMVQLAFGADILWHYRKLVLWALIPTTIYLCIGDALAIESGTWTIDPAQSTGILILGLPLEEAIFFLLTNTLVVFGVTLVLARESHLRISPAWRTRLRSPLLTTPAKMGADGSP